MKTYKVYIPFDKKGQPWLGFMGTTEKRAWEELEGVWGTNKEESKQEGFTVVVCDIVPREVPE